MTSRLTAELHLSRCDIKLARIIEGEHVRWPTESAEDPIWGLIRIVIAQQVSTRVACQLAERVKAAYPQITSPAREAVPDVTCLRSFGLPARRADCCFSILQKSHEIRARIVQGETWEEVLDGIKGIGAWTISVFRIMVLRDPDVMPLGDVGLERAISKVYGHGQDVEVLGERWRPYRSVACWYLWRTLGNEQLG
jgi:DNA-3-methyladenine glycosylase II